MMATERAKRFQGRFRHVLDSKGRLSIPAPFREQLERMGSDILVVTNSEQWLDVYPLDQWETFMERVDSLPRFSKDAELFRLFYVSSAQEVQLDRQGRILIPQTLREEVHLNKEAVILGMGITMQIWEKGIWEQVHEEAKRRFREIKNNLSEVL